MGVPPLGLVALSAASSAATWGPVSGLMPTVGSEATPHTLSTLKKLRPIDAVLPSASRFWNTVLSASVVICHLLGLVESAGAAASSQAALSCSGGRLHSMLPLRSTRNSTLAGSSSDL